MKRRDLEFETLVREALKGKKVPILVLDRRWHTLFPQGEKPAEIIQLEEKLNELLKRQGYLTPMHGISIEDIIPVPSMLSKFS